MKRTDILKQIIESFAAMQRGMAARKSGYYKEGLPYGQKAALFCISFNKTTNIKQLALELHVTSAGATQHVEALVQEGLVERIDDPQDRRNVIVTLSDKGEVLIARLMAERLEIMADVFADVTDSELQGFLTVTNKVNAKLTK